MFNYVVNVLFYFIRLNILLTFNTLTFNFVNSAHIKMIFNIFIYHNNNINNLKWHKTGVFFIENSKYSTTVSEHLCFYFKCRLFLTCPKLSRHHIPLKG